MWGSDLVFEENHFNWNMGQMICFPPVFSPPHPAISSDGWAPGCLFSKGLPCVPPQFWCTRLMEYHQRNHGNLEYSTLLRAESSTDWTACPSQNYCRVMHSSTLKPPSDANSLTFANCCIHCFVLILNSHSAPTAARCSHHCGPVLRNGSQESVL